MHGGAWLFVAHSLLGDSGYLKAVALENKIAQQKLELQNMQKEREALETRTKLLRPDSLDMDMLDERARATLGYTKPNEYIIYYDKK